ncbi:MAG: hypothetical protein ACRDJC_23130, partial [Thermomicrobiales bacterium]
AVGFLAVARVYRLWVRLNPTAATRQPAARFSWQGAMYGFIMATPYVGLLGVAALLWNGHPSALGWLAVVEGALLSFGTAAAWLILSNAGNA